MAKPAPQWRVRAFLLAFFATICSLFALGPRAEAKPTTDEIAVHVKTGFPLDGRHRDVDCESCHLNGVFEGAPKLCGACHNGSLASGKPPNHVRSGNQCEECHATNGWTPARFDHSTVSGPCAVCHNGREAQGKTSGHIVTVADCGECHSITGWSNATFNHAAVTGNCASCHNGTTATGKAASHLPTSN
ncbi:MAG: hypothetical protein HXY21_09750, partial [Parvularculaceae bacterium]|nr:hypothetical protein [Parvularculaceae bacterium]